MFHTFKVHPVVVAAMLGFAVTALVSQGATATAGLPFGILDQTGCCQRCPACDHACKFKAESVEEELEGFVVESKVICIPRVVFPWQKRPTCGGCDSSACQQCHNGGRTRKVCVLKTDKYKCPNCEYSWSAEKKPAGSCGCSGSRCDQSCDEGCGTSSGCDQQIFYLQSEHATGMVTDGP